MSETDNYMSKSITALMLIIKVSSIMVTVLMGKLKTAPRQACLNTSEAHHILYTQFQVQLILLNVV